MKQQWLSMASILVLPLVWGFKGDGLAEDTGRSKSPSVEERLSAIESKLQSRENRLDQDLGKGGSKIGAASASEAAAAQVAERLESLDQKMRIFERKRELEQEALAAKLKEIPVVTASGKDGFGFKSADNSFQLK